MMAGPWDFKRDIRSVSALAVARLEADCRLPTPYRT